jgi:hypothetical protein
MPNQLTRANAGGPRWVPNRTHWAARITQFWRSAEVGRLANRDCIGRSSEYQVSLQRLN